MHGRTFKMKKDSTHRPEFKQGDLVKAVMVSRMGDVGITKDLNATHGYNLRLMPYELEPIDPIPEDVCKLCHYQLASGDHESCIADRKCERCKGPTGPGDPICPKCVIDDWKKKVGV